MELVSKKEQYISKEELDSLVDFYLHKQITYETLISSIIQKQKRLVISNICRTEDGIVAVEVLSRRMEHAGIEVSI